MAIVVNVAEKADARGVQSIEVGAKLLNVLVDEEEPMMLKDLARLAGIAPAQAHAYLVSYRKMGLIEQEESAGRYRLGPLALELGITRMRTADPMKLASQAVSELSFRSGLNVALVVWGSFGPTVIQVEESGSQLNMNTRVGTVYSLTSTASGRAFAAFMPEGLIREAIKAERKEEAGSARVGKPRYLSKPEMEAIRALGYSTIEDPPVPGINALSAPVFDHLGQMQCAITLIGLESVMSIAPDSAYIQMLLNCTQRLSFELGYQRPNRTMGN